MINRRNFIKNQLMLSLGMCFESTFLLASIKSQRQHKLGLIINSKSKTSELIQVEFGNQINIHRSSLPFNRGHSLISLKNGNLICIGKHENKAFLLDPKLQILKDFSLPMDSYYAGHACLNKKQDLMLLSAYEQKENKNSGFIQFLDLKDLQLKKSISFNGGMPHEIHLSKNEKEIWIDSYARNEYKTSILSSISMVDGKTIKDIHWDSNEGNPGHFVVAEDQVIGAFVNFKGVSQKTLRKFKKDLNQFREILGGDGNIAKSGKIWKVEKSANGDYASNDFYIDQNQQRRPQSVIYHPNLGVSCISFAHSNTLAFIDSKGKDEILELPKDKLIGPRGICPIPETNLFAVSGTKKNIVIVNYHSKKIERSISIDLGNHAHLAYL